MYFDKKERGKGIHISVRDEKGDYSGRISVLYHT